MAHRKPVSVATGEKKVWARGDTQENKRAEEEAELKMEEGGSPLLYRERQVTKGFQSHNVYSENSSKQSCAFSLNT